MYKYIVFFISILFLMYSCEDENFSNDPSLKLDFSSDTVMFDTVFTTIGSSTRYLKVYNRNKYDLKISSIQLAKSSSSFFRLNVDGQPTNRVENIEIRSKDSLYIFVEVTVDPTNQNNPLFIADSIVFTTNGNIQDVDLIAWGQDVHFFRSKSIYNDSIFLADKPYLIYDYLFVDSDVELKIEAGAKIHFHNQAQLIVAGTLKVEGTFDNPIIFEGDRLESFYRDKAGQWGGLWLYAGSKNNEISWAVIKNSIIGLMVDTCVTVDQPTLKISNTIIENSSSAGLYARGAKIEANNSLFSNSGQISVALTMGGSYQFYHCTIANYWGQYIFRSGPALLLNNYYLYQQTVNGPILVEPRDMEEASFYNCIIFGSRNQEFEIDDKYKDQPVDALMNYKFDHCILKVLADYDISDATRFINVIKDDPKFRDTQKLKFELDTLSPAKDFGLLNYGLLFPIDLKNINHTADSKPDLGAYERVE